MAVDAKICGLTRPADAERAVRLGASFLGVVFAESPRQVTGPVALEVVRAGEGVPVLGVFVDTRADDILRIRDRTGIAGAQLHAGYEAADRARLAAEIAAWKQARGFAIADPAREREMLRTLLANAGPGFDRAALRRILVVVLRESRRLALREGRRRGPGL